MEDIIIKIQENRIGPITMHKLRSLFNHGVFAPTDLVWDPEENAWVRAREVKELAEALFNSNKP